MIQYEHFGQYQHLTIPKGKIAIFSIESSYDFIILEKVIITGKNATAKKVIDDILKNTHTKNTRSLDIEIRKEGEVVEKGKIRFARLLKHDIEYIQPVFEIEEEEMKIIPLQHFGRWRTFCGDEVRISCNIAFGETYLLFVTTPRAKLQAIEFEK